MPAFNEEAPARGRGEPQDAPEAAPVSKAPEAAAAPQAPQESPETVSEDIPYLAPKPETPPVTEPTAAEAASGLATGPFRDYLLSLPATREWPADEHPADHPSRLPPAARPCKAGG